MKKTLFGLPIVFIRQNALYFIALFVLVCIAIVYIPSSWRTIGDTKQQISQLEDEINALKSKQEIYQYYSQLKLDDLVRDISSQIPDTEDSFSIYNALEYLGTQENVVIESYSSPIQGKKNNVSEVTLKIKGGRRELDKLLQKIHFKTGRFITVNSVACILSEQSCTLHLSFYSGKSTFGTTFFIPDEQLFATISNELSSTIQRAEPPREVFYEVSSDPFYSDALPFVATSSAL